MSLAQEAPGLAPPAASLSSGTTLFQNVRIFDGRSAALSAPSNVLMRDNIDRPHLDDPIANDAGASPHHRRAAGEC